MSVFEAYARYYDLLNREKDYKEEARYIHSLAQKLAPEHSMLLDVGCGTGRHAEILRQLGFDVSGIDRSAEMVAEARRRNADLDIRQADASNFSFDGKFGVVCALFHVMSYLTEQHELESAFKNVRSHLETGGLFFFDCWHAPAVIKTGPEIRVRRMRNESSEVVRIAEPEHFPDRNRVDVKYQVFVRENDVWREFSEVHSMRYLFPKEIEELCTRFGLELVHSEEWMSSADPSEDTWNVLYAARAIS